MFLPRKTAGSGGSAAALELSLAEARLSLGASFLRVGEMNANHCRADSEFPQTGDTRSQGLVDVFVFLD